MIKKKHDWIIVYDAAIRPDGTYFFPEKLSAEYLEAKRRELGSYIFANQMMNRIIPEGDQDFKKEWLKYYEEKPERVNTFAFIDPAISQEEKSDYTALLIVDVDTENNWYVRVAKRYKITATQIVQLVFQIDTKFKPNVIGIESVAYQKSLIHFITDEMKKRNHFLKLYAHNPGTDKTKEDRIRGLIPRFEWGSIFLSRGLVDLEDEYSKFPRGGHDDLLDALSSIQSVAYPATKKKERAQVPAPNHPDYEKWYIEQLKKGQKSYV